MRSWGTFTLAFPTGFRYHRSYSYTGATSSALVYMTIWNGDIHPSHLIQYILRTLSIPHKHKTQDKKGGKEKEMQ